MATEGVTVDFALLIDCSPLTVMSLLSGFITGDRGAAWPLGLIKNVFSFRSIYSDQFCMNLIKYLKLFKLELQKIRQYD